MRRMEDKLVHKICRMIEDGYRVGRISELLGIDKARVRDIKAGRTYKRISCNYVMTNEPITKATMYKVCSLLACGCDDEFISSKIHISKELITRIRRGESCKEISENFNISQKPLEDSLVHQICIMMEKDYSDYEISEKLHVDCFIIRMIRRKVAYTDIRSQYTIHTMVKLNDEDVHKLCQMYKENIPMYEISSILGISSSLIISIIDGKKHRKISKNYDMRKRHI